MKNRAFHLALVAAISLPVAAHADDECADRWPSLAEMAGRRCAGGRAFGKRALANIKWHDPDMVRQRCATRPGANGYG